MTFEASAILLYWLQWQTSYPILQQHGQLANVKLAPAGRSDQLALFMLRGQLAVKNRRTQNAFFMMVMFLKINPEQGLQFIHVCIHPH